MKNYKFEVEKSIKNTIEIKAENYQEALLNLFELLVVADEEIFEFDEEKEVSYDILLDNVTSKKELEMIKNLQEILQNLSENDEDFEQNIDINDEKNEEDLCDRKTKIRCKKKK